MEYIKNGGQVKVLDVKGNVKWISEHLANDRYLMKDMELTPVQAPLHLPPLDPAKVSNLVDISVADSSMGITDSILTEVKEDADQSEDFEIETVEEKPKKSVKPKK